MTRRRGLRYPVVVEKARYPAIVIRLITTEGLSLGSSSRRRGEGSRESVAVSRRRRRRCWRCVAGLLARPLASLPLASLLPDAATTAVTTTTATTITTTTTVITVDLLDPDLPVVLLPLHAPNLLRP